MQQHPNDLDRCLFSRILKLKISSVCSICLNEHKTQGCSFTCQGNLAFDCTETGSAHEWGFCIWWDAVYLCYICDVIYVIAMKHLKRDFKKEDKVLWISKLVHHVLVEQQTIKTGPTTFCLWCVLKVKSETSVIKDFHFNKHLSNHKKRNLTKVFGDLEIVEGYM